MLAIDGPWSAHLDRLAGLHRRLGTKIVVNPGKAVDWQEPFLGFQCRSFYVAHYLFVFRHPAAVLCSTLSFKQMRSDTAATASGILANCTQTVALFTRLVRILPNVRPVIHEDVGPATFAALSDWLDIALPGPRLYHDAGRVRHREVLGLNDREAHGLDLLSGVFDDLRTELAAPSGRLQIKQNRLSPDISHLPPIGSIDGRAVLLERYLTHEPDPAEAAS